MRGRTVDTLEPTGIGVVNPGTRKAGIIAARVVAGFAAFYLITQVRPLNHSFQTGALAARRWLIGRADTWTHRHTKVPVDAVRSAGHGWITGRDGMDLVAYACIAYLIVAAALYVRSKRVPGAGLGKTALVVLAVIVGAAVVLVVLAAVVPASHPALAAGARGLGAGMGGAAHWVAKVEMP